MPPDGIPSYRVPFMSTDYMVASGHYLAALAGFRVLKDGGNAVDAGVASGIAINVTLPHLTSFAGVAPIILYRADIEEVVTISGLGRWPKAATLEEYKKRYNGDMPLGMPRSVVPAACDAWLTALERYGTMTFEQVVAPSIELAEKGFPASHHLSRSLSAARSYIEQCPVAPRSSCPMGIPLRPERYSCRRTWPGSSTRWWMWSGPAPRRAERVALGLPGTSSTRERWPRGWFGTRRKTRAFSRWKTSLSSASRWKNRK